MSEKPILFSPPMVRAILEGRKTVTRRVVKPQLEKCPYGNIGDELWVRETWRRFSLLDVHEEYKNVIYGADYEGKEYTSLQPWIPSIHMFRKDSRIQLKITDIRIERLQEITEAGARAEGISDGGCISCGLPEPCGCSYPRPDARESFINLWDSINGKTFPWDSNPRVWIVEFVRI